ncbi:MAG: UvrD-helicase domain-containing protein [Acidimicrobiales bacterium]
MDIHLYSEGETWFVWRDGTAARFAARADAFAAARELAREHSPSRIVREPPPAPVTATAARPRVDDDLDVDPDDIDISDFDTETLFDDEAPARRRPAPRVDAPSGASVRPGAAASRSAPPRRSPAPVAAPATGPDDVAPGPVRPWAALAGPPALGRSLLLPAGGPVPEPWADCERVRVTAAALADPEVHVTVRAAYLARTPVVYELDPPDLAPTPCVIDDELWEVPVDVELTGDATWELLRANAVDGRDPQAPTWWATGAAVAAGAEACTGDAAPGTADVVLGDGRAAWCDGGPLQAFAPDEPVPGTVVVPRVTLERGRLDPNVATVPAHLHDALAPDQLAAVTDPRPRARIIAPAGSGKTRVLTERTRALLRDQLVPAASLCLVAFNKRAQLEMLERTTDLGGLRIRTLNALALAVLNGSDGFADTGRRVRTIDELDVRGLINELVRFPRRANTDPAAAWIDALSSARLGLRDPRQVEAEFGGEVDGFAEVYPRYRRELARRGVVDFDEQIAGAVELLLRDPAVRRRAQQQCRVLLVDEFQDLTPAHLLLLRLLAGPELAVFGVGDDDQTIYGYSGASPRWLLTFDRFVPGADELALEVNYRCPAPVVTAASNLLTHNAERVPKQIHPGPAAVDDAEALTVVTVPDPTTATVARVHELLAAGAAPGDIAVLTRVNTLLAPVLVALRRDGVGVASRESGRFLERTGVAAALAWLRLALDPERLRDRDVQQAARRPGRSLSPRVIEWMAEQRTPAGIERLAGRLSDQRDTDKVLGFLTDLRRIAARAADGEADTATLVEIVRSELGLERSMQTLDAAHRGRNTAAHADDLRALVALGRLHPDPGSFEPFLRSMLEGPADPDGVTLATIHTVKGLEWPHVIVHDASQGLFPHRLSTDIEEERRVFHVAITRPRQRCTIVADVAAPSMFLDELAAPAATPPEPATLVDAPAADAAARRADVEATIGLEVRWGGYDCTVAGADPEGVTLAAGRSSFAVPYGSVVTVDGRRRTLARSTGSARTARRAAAEAALGDADEDVVTALKAWRLERARGDGVPAYVVMNDRTLAEVATTLPRTLDDLLGVSGIGPSKLERYGDEVLAVVDGVRPA